ncbi:hypothetical protein ACOMHN_008707 [Nucella lapillus]
MLSEIRGVILTDSHLLSSIPIPYSHPIMFHPLSPNPPSQERPHCLPLPTIHNVSIMTLLLDEILLSTIPIPAFTGEIIQAMSPFIKK